MDGYTKQNKTRNTIIRWFRHVWERHVEVSIKRVEQLKNSPIVRGRERSRKTIGQIIKRELDINSLSLNLICDGDFMTLIDPCNRLHLVENDSVVGSVRIV